MACLTVTEAGSASGSGHMAINVSKSKCPFQSAAAFVNNQARVIGLLPDAVHDLSLLGNTQLYAGISEPDSAIVNKLKLNPYEYKNRLTKTRLYATTAEAPTASVAEGGKDGKKEKKKKRGGTKPLEVVVLGLSHHKASVDVREKLAIPEGKIQYNTYFIIFIIIDLLILLLLF